MTKADERTVFEVLVRRHGRPAPEAKVLAEQMTYDGDCWSAAWREAQARGGRYVEGSCRLAGRRVRAHAWVEVDGPFGAILVECTQGYEDASGYVGIAVDATPGGLADRTTLAWDRDHRASVIEWFIVAGFVDMIPALVCT